MKRCAGVLSSSPPASNSAVYSVNPAPNAGLTCTIAEHAFIPGRVVRTKVSAVSSKWFACWELRVRPRLSTVYPLLKFGRGSQLIEKMQSALDCLLYVLASDRFRRIMAATPHIAHKNPPATH